MVTYQVKVKEWKLSDQLQLRVISTKEEVEIACQLLAELMSQQNPLYSKGELAIEIQNFYTSYISLVDLIIQDGISIIAKDQISKRYVGALLNIDFFHYVQHFKSFEDEHGNYQMQKYNQYNQNPEDNLRRKGLKFLKSQFNLYTYQQMLMFNQDALQRHKTVDQIGGGVTSEFQRQGLSMKMLELSAQFQHQQFGYQYCVSTQTNHISQKFANKYYRSLLRIQFDCTNFIVENVKIFEGVLFPDNKVIYQAQVFFIPFYSDAKL
eukprot:403370907